MRHMQINHRGSDLFVTEQFLDRMQMGAGFQQMRGKGMPEGMNREMGSVLGFDNSQQFFEPAV
jgi:hypothetical protein